MEWLEIPAPSVDMAKELALERLGVHESEVEIEILAEGKTGLFGRVKEQARIRARIQPTPVRPKVGRQRGRKRSRPTGRERNDDTTRSKTPQASSDSAPTAQARASSAATAQTSSSRSRSKARTTRGAEDSTAKADQRSASDAKRKAAQSMSNDHPRMSLEDQADLAERFVAGIGEIVGVNLEFSRHKTPTDATITRIEAHGDGIGVLVGHRGSTAQSIDDLVRTVLQRSGGSIQEGKIRMDIGGIKGRRHAALAEFAVRVADDVRESAQEVRLEPMNRADRKVVHDAVAGIEGVASRSQDMEPNRHVVIAPADPDA